MGFSLGEAFAGEVENAGLWGWEGSWGESAVGRIR